MFNRFSLKSRAKMVLSLHYWPTFLAIFLVSIITETASMFISLPAIPSSLAMGSDSLSIAQLYTLGISLLMAIILGFLLTVFLEGPLMVGVKRFLLDTALENKADISNIFYGFKNGYKSIATAALMKSLIILAYGLLPILIASGIMIVMCISFADEVWVAVAMLILLYASFIPLVMKMYDYYLTDYILADNPNMYWKDVLKRSKGLMRGNRWSTFVMHLSFLGWIMLGILACGIGVMFINPYIQATDTQLYMELSGQNDAEPTANSVEI